ncbi:MAG: hypothetical protein AAGF44_11085 [Pseudomonadota bacterium]
MDRDEDLEDRLRQNNREMLEEVMAAIGIDGLWRLPPLEARLEKERV